MRKLLNAFIIAVIQCFVFWAATVGFIKLITMCFDVDFSLRIATGIWLSMWLIKWVSKLEWEE